MRDRPAVRPTVAEQELLELFLEDQELRHAVLPELEREIVADLPTAPIFRALREIDEEGAILDFDSLNSRIQSDSLAVEVLPMLFMNSSTNAGDDVEEHRRHALSCIVALRLMRIDRRIGELSAEMAAAERSGDLERLDRLALEQVEWARRRTTLQGPTESFS
jgi:hypothetical protein